MVPVTGSKRCDAERKVVLAREAASDPRVSSKGAGMRAAGDVNCDVSPLSESTARARWDIRSWASWQARGRAPQLPPRILA